MKKRLTLIQAIGAMVPGFAHLKNTIPLSSHITTNDLIGLLIWYLLYIPLVLHWNLSSFQALRIL
jgi:hypothetical protein